MVPTINMADLIVTGPPNGPIKGNIETGTIITYTLNDEPITHRITSIDGNKIKTRGYNSEDVDPWVVQGQDIIGVYIFKVPFIGFILNFIRTKFGWFLVILLPAAILIGLLIKDIIKASFSE